MKYIPIILLVALTCGLGSSCSYIKNRFLSQKSQVPGAERKKEQPPLYLGTVHQVYPERQFALLRIIGPMPRAGVPIISHPADGSTARMGNLVIPEGSQANRGIIVADIRSGAVESGDRIFLYRNISQQTPRDVEQPIDISQTTDMPEVRPSTSVPSPSTHTQNIPSRPVVEQGNVQSVFDAPSQQSIPISEGIEVSAPVDMPQSMPTHMEAPSLPETAPAYLDDIPNDINQWN